MSCAVSSETDLGSQFNEPQLNRKIQDPQSGEERPLFTLDPSEGNAKFCCSVCQITVIGIKTLQSHILGKKHKNKVSGYKIIEGPRVEEPQQRSLLGLLVSQFRGVAVLGLEYVVEVKLSSLDESFCCTLCTVDSDLPNIMSHLLSSSHRLAFLARHFPSLNRRLTAQPVSQWTINNFQQLESFVAGIVARFGLATPTVVNSLLLWEREKENILRRIESLDHARE